MNVETPTTHHVLVKDPGVFFVVCEEVEETEMKKEMNSHGAFHRI